MKFTKKDNIYRITRITGPQANILGVNFKDKNNNRTSNNIKVIAWDFPNMNKIKKKILTSKEEVLSSGLESINQALGTHHITNCLTFIIVHSTTQRIQYIIY